MTWRVTRQDDNGNVFVVAEELEEAAARKLAADFEARAHKQMYFAEPGPEEAPGAPAGGAPRT